jgi:plasmid stabilization system protein ParE
LGFRVKITDFALADAEEYVEYIRIKGRKPEAAERWFRGLVEAIYSLEQNPGRCPVIPEQREFEFEVRHLIYRSHRLIFAIDSAGKAVTVFRVYHGKRRRLSVEGLV